MSEVGIAFADALDPTSVDQWATVLAAFPGVKLYAACDTPDWWSEYKCFRDAVSVSEATSPIVVVSPENARRLPGTTSLVSYEHPEDAVYLFGGDHTILETDLPYSDCVFIPSDGAEFYSHVAGSIVLYDRMLKRG